jgi:phosphate transport system substrate-binding protein
MKRATLMITAMALFCSCHKDDLDAQFKIKGLTLENFPIIDGSTSTDPLVKLIASKLLGYEYQWQQLLHMNGSWALMTNLPDEFVSRHLKCSQTHNAFINLINNEADMIFSARKMSADEKAYAAEAGVTLIETPVALDALVFITHPNNRVKSVTQKQLQDIYTGKIKNWKDVGGSDAPITPYARNRNSGSQELFETMVLDEPLPDDFPSELIISGMSPLLSFVQTDINGLGYTVFYYKEVIYSGAVEVRTLAVNGVHPDKKTIRSGKYPYTAEVYAIIRSDLEKSSISEKSWITYQIYDLLLTKAGKKVITESGYVAN